MVYEQNFQGIRDRNGSLPQKEDSNSNYTPCLGHANSLLRQCIKLELLHYVKVRKMTYIEHNRLETTQRGKHPPSLSPKYTVSKMVVLNFRDNFAKS